MNVLAIGAHPDDFEFMCSGTLLKCRDRGDNIFLALTTSGNTGSNVIPTKEETAAIREKEQLACAAHYKAQTRFLRFDDEGLLDCPESRQAVLDAIRWANPDLILCNPPWDPSPDHGMTGKLVTAVLPYVTNKLMPSQFPAMEKMPSTFFFSQETCVDATADIYVDVTEQMDEKVEMVGLYESQISWIADVAGVPDVFLTSPKIRCRYDGLGADCDYAEGFIAHLMMGHAPNYKLLP